MADVAARLGVSKMTVSRALARNASSARSTSEALRQRILRTCHEMGYVIDQTARTFSTKRSGFVAALLPAAWERSGYYPTEYCIRYRPDNQETTVSLEKFVYREAR